MTKQELIEQLAIVKKVSISLGLSSHEQRNKTLHFVAEGLKNNADVILEENKKDLEKIDENNSMKDRLLLTKERIGFMIADIQTVINLPDPLNNSLEQREIRENLEIKKVSVPFGVVGVIYESRPNVTVDVASLCLKSGNGIILKGGEEAKYSNAVLVKIIKQAFNKAGFSEKLILNIDLDNRELVKVLLESKDYVDLVVPRGGEGLINFVRNTAKVSVIETGAGVCHTFVDESADVEMAVDIVFNAKTSRPSVCNALDTLLVHKNITKKFFEDLAKKLQTKKVEIFADDISYAILKKLGYTYLQKTQKGDYGKEFLSLKMAIKTVENVNVAIEHISVYSTKHSEAIVTENIENADEFLNKVDAACVYHNASTRFTDGSQFGIGGEIGISTQKLHARGPMSIKELTTYKWIIKGQGQIRT